MTCFGGFSQVGGVRVLGMFADMLEEALWFQLLSLFLFFFPSASWREKVPGEHGAPCLGLASSSLPLCLAALPLVPFPLCQADSLLAVIYGRAWHRAHRLENFQFTQEFPEK